MDDFILDLNNLMMMLTSVLQQMDRMTLEQITAVADNSILEEMILEAIGVDRERLNPEEEERFTAMIKFVLHKVRDKTDNLSGNP